MTVHNSEPTAQRPVVILPQRSPALEAIAREVLRGAAEESNASPTPILFTGADANLVAVGEAPLVFLGWRSDDEESRREARKALAKVARLADRPRFIAKFEASLSGASSAAHPEDGDGAAAPLTPLGPVEPFAVTPADTASPHELERARRWGAEMVSQWKSARVRAPESSDRTVTKSTVPHALSWCGAME
jgi:hypothetical protein